MAFLLICTVAFVLICVLYFASFWISYASSFAASGDREALTAYECGFEPSGTARVKFEILYYVIGLLYLVFDLEIVFLFPLATI
jgi:NADH:ubiquinone oxidoreductase subunit 3 (subunit A)